MRGVDRVKGEGLKAKVSAVMIAATGSGSGKTTITCGLLRLLKKRGFNPISFKCGPDYIDPMFHKRVLGIESRNLDLFLSDEIGVKKTFEKGSRGHDIAVVEGVMGYYDGLGGITSECSGYHLARVLKLPTILLVDCKGKSYSVLAEIKGFLAMEADSQIEGVILNRVSPMLYRGLSREIEEVLGIRVIGMVPKLESCNLESRHLGLIPAGEVKNLEEIVDGIEKQMEDTIDVDALLDVCKDVERKPVEESDIGLERESYFEGDVVKIAVARDEAFCFYYEENFDLLKSMGGEIVEFSPLKDERIPDGCSGLILGGGYPELHLEKLQSNHRTRTSILEALEGGMPCLAECGGFMYLHETIEDKEGNSYEGVGFIGGKSYYEGRLVRFGYATIKALKDNILCPQGDEIRCHEFHHWDSTNSGDVFKATKPVSFRTWDCMVEKKNTLAGYPHLFYNSNISIVERFIHMCRRYIA